MFVNLFMEFFLIIGRKQELALLEKLYNSPSFQFLIMYGRRRVRKTTILQKFAQSHDCIFPNPGTLYRRLFSNMLSITVGKIKPSFLSSAEFLAI